MEDRDSGERGADQDAAPDENRHVAGGRGHDGAGGGDERWGDGQELPIRDVG